MEKSMREVLPTESLRQKIKRSNSQSDLNDYSSDEVSRSVESPGNSITARLHRAFASSTGTVQKLSTLKYSNCNWTKLIVQQLKLGL